MNRFRFGAVAIGLLYAACADPPKKYDPNAGGTDAGGASAGEDSGGSATGATDTAGGTAGNGGSVPTAGSAAGGDAAGEGGAPETPAAGAGGAGEGGAAGAGVDPCEGVVVGEASSLPVPPMTQAVARPDGAVGNLKIIDWAGFKGALSYTFDDGLSSQVAHYDELNAVGVPLTFYLVGNNDHMDPVWSEAVVDGHELGNHTMRHCRANGTDCGWPGGTPFESPERDLDDCSARIKSQFGVEDVYTFASPYGDTNWVEPVSHRFLLARGTYDDPGGVVPNGKLNQFNLPCHISNENETAEPSPTGGFNRIADDVRAKGSWRLILNHSFGGDGGYNPTAIGEVVKAMEYARDLEDVWVGTVIGVGAYWIAQREISPVKPEVDGDNKIYSWTLPEHFPPRQHLRVKVDGGTVTQCGVELPWDEHGYYEIALDAGSVTISP